MLASGNDLPKIKAKVTDRIDPPTSGSQNTLRDDTWSQTLLLVAQKDRKAFERFFNHYVPLIRGYCLSKPVPDQSSSLPDELAQEVMIKVWQKANTFDPKKASASTWVFTLARNCRIDLLRRSNRHIAQPLEIDDLWADEEEHTPVTHLQKARDKDLIAKAWQVLPKDQIQVIRKVFMEGKTHLEAAEEMDLPLGTVKSRVRLGLKKLQLIVANRSNEVDQ
ncbi:sigma-70 family RNA polymerase sigma factor [Sessilibacter sp. MAH2]